MIDATRGIEAQDVNIFSLIQRNKKGLVVVVNKWDLVEDKSTKAIKHYEDAIRERFAPFTDFPIIFTSALTKQRIYKVLETAVEVYANRKRTVPTSQLNNTMQEDIAAYPPPSNKGKFIKIKYITMLKGCAGAHFHLLLQPPAVGEGALPALSRKQNPRALGFLRHANQRVYAREVISGFITYHITFYITFQHEAQVLHHGRSAAVRCGLMLRG